MELDPETQITIAGVLLTIGSALLTMLWKGGKWIGSRLMDEKEGYLTRITNAHLRLVDALQALPTSMQQIQETDQKQTELLEQIVEAQVGKESHPRVLRDKLNLMIQAIIKIKLAFRFFMEDDNESGNRLLNEAESLLTKSLEI